MAITETLARNYANLIEEGILPREIENSGTKNDIFYTGIHAIKTPHVVTPHSLKLLIHEEEIANALQAEGINVPKMHGVHDYNGTPFLVMEKLRLTPFKKLTREERAEASRQYAKQIGEARDAGLYSEDIDWKTNYGFDNKKGKGFFYDFEDWKRESVA